jgi:hypothetical protein
VQIIPISEVAAKDEFAGIKNISRDDVLAAHRTPPQLVGIVPINNAGFGNVVDAKDVFFELEIVPLQARLLELNDWLGVEAVKFKPFVPSAKGTAAGGESLGQRGITALHKGAYPIGMIGEKRDDRAGGFHAADAGGVAEILGRVGEPLNKFLGREAIALELRSAIEAHFASSRAARRQY